ncbi:DUF1294 domain-containing protein [Ethanoligenens harbinense]|nr:DUF1294 domain-containing protein [Ethanoligenens harbinense]
MRGDGMSAPEGFWLFFAGISLLAVVLTVCDKHRAVRHRYRIRKPLAWVAFAGGAAAMFLTMLIIRHKTRHVKFMLGLPVFMLLHAGALLILQWTFHLPVILLLFGR